MQTSTSKCHVCGKTAYPMEAIQADGRTFHKTCFKCKICNSIMKLGSFASMEMEYYCKPCFKKTFLSKGNYSEGFGKQKPQAEFESKKDGSKIEGTNETVVVSDTQ